MDEYSIQRRLFTEFIGTLLLTYTVCITAVWGSSGGIHPGFLIATILMVMIYCLGHISGAHFNPTVTVSIWINGSFKRGDVFPYAVSQLVAGVSGAILSGLTYSRQNIQAKTEPESLLLNSEIHEVLLSEFAFTFALVYVILYVAFNEGTSGNHYYGVAIASVVLIGAILVGDVSMASFNPAVTISLISVGKLTITQSWMHLIPQLAAGPFAAWVYSRRIATNA